MLIMKNNNVAMVILNYNDSSTTIALLESVNKYQIIDYIVIVDNCSTDNSIMALQKYQNDKCYIIETQENRGYSFGNNVGIKYAIHTLLADTIILANPDVLITEESLSHIIKTLNEQENSGLVSCLMENANGDECVSAWKLPNYVDCVFDNLYILKRLIRKNQDYEQAIQAGKKEGKSIPVDVIPGSLFAFKANTLESVDYFDEDTFLYYEENILCSKLKKQGYINYLDCSCNYIHNHSVSINKNIKSLNKKLRIAYDSRLIYAKKYLCVTPFKMQVLDFAYHIGSFNITCIKAIQRIIGKLSIKKEYKS